MYLEMFVTSSDVDVTSAISSDVDLTSPISSDVSNVETVKCVLGFCYDCPSEKDSQKFLRISVEKMRDFFFVFRAKKIAFWD